MRWWKSRWVLTLLAAAVVCGGGTYFYLSVGKTKAANKAPEEILSTVKKGNIRSSVSGTSQLEATDMQMITAPSDGIVKVMNLTRNTSVKQGDVLFQLSNATLDTNLQKAKSNLEKLGKDLGDLQNQMNSLSKTAPITGKLTYGNNLDVGSTVNDSAKIATIAATDSLSVTLAFPLEDAVQLKKGDLIDLTPEGFLLTKTGTVLSVSQTPKADSKGGKLVDVEIAVGSESTLDAGITITKGAFPVSGRVSESKASGVLQYAKIVTVTAGVSGTISNMPFKNGQIVKQGEVIASIENSTLKDSLESKKISYEEQEVALQDLQDKVNALTVTAPIDGVFSTDFVNKKTNILASYAVGAKVPNGMQFGAVATTDKMQLPITVDELDLPNIKTGQKAEIRVDSAGNRVFQAVVSQVSSVGTTTNGVTFFDVVLQVSGTKDLKYGMTATGEILVQDKKDVLLVPTEAIQSQQGKRFVTVKLADGSTEKREIKVGIRDKTQIEVTEGVKEGEQIVIPVIQRSTKMNQQDANQMRQQFQNGQGGQGGAGGFPQGAGGQGGQGGAATQGGAGGAGGNAVRRAQ